MRENGRRQTEGCVWRAAPLWPGENEGEDGLLGRRWMHAEYIFSPGQWEREFISREADCAIAHRGIALPVGKYEGLSAVTSNVIKPRIGVKHTHVQARAHTYTRSDTHTHTHAHISDRDPRQRKKSSHAKKLSQIDVFCIRLPLTVIGCMCRPEAWLYTYSFWMINEWH